MTPVMIKRRRSQVESKSAPLNFSILDSQSHTWREAPSLPAKLASLSVSVLDGKIYVAGGHVSEFLKNTLEVFDTETQTWDLKTIPCTVTKSNVYHPRSACIDGKFHVKTSTEAVVYNCKESGWDLFEREMGKYMIAESYCVIENVLYSALHGELIWYDSDVCKWRCLKGLEGLPDIPFGACVRLADYGGKLAVLWEGDVFDLRHGGSYRNIWCAEIALDRRKKGRGIWGEVEWCDDVLTIPKLCKLVKVLSVTL
ncbi:unnamed protein product [Microthlaspi erraticum]|uniref:FKB95-like N-terminal Kelch domain-containing protein n=1 Tax=Microthlaspi erraticum TaxID=1685480 RepID=A0A6D2IH02_9BRAS|nr:unnamed protein product [Microthlaspi erraticum]